MSITELIKIKKMKRSYFYISLCLLTALIFFSVGCKKEGPSIDNYFLNYKIDDVPVTSDYTVGAFYYTNTAAFSANMKYTPLAGKYVSSTTTGIPAATIQMHIDEAAAAKIDYFIFTVRSPTFEAANFKADTTMLHSFLTAPNASKIHFAIQFQFTAGDYGVTLTGNNDANGNPRGTPIEANATKLAGFYADMEAVGKFMSRPGYQKINGKALLLFNKAQDMNSNMDAANPGSTQPLFAEVRKRLMALGSDVYIIGEQDNWSAPNNYFYKYQNSFDALYEANMVDNKGILDRNYLFAQLVDQNWAYWKKELESWPAGGLTPGQRKMEFVPCIQAAYNYQINAPTNTNLSIQRSPDFYKTYTNVAKRNASGSRLILVDSFNNFNVDTQIEPTQEYGTTYMDITKQAFKVN